MPTARDRLGEAPFDALRAAGQAMTLDQAVAYALAVGQPMSQRR